MGKNLRMVSSNGWQTSVADKNIIEDLFPTEYTVKQLKYLGLMVSVDCYISINGEEPFFVDHRLGIDYDVNFEPIESLIIKDSGINYYFLAGY